MSKIPRATAVRGTLPFLCRIKHRWKLEHQTGDWRYYECCRCNARRILGPRDYYLKDAVQKLTEAENMDLKWLFDAFGDDNEVKQAD